MSHFLKRSLLLRLGLALSTITTLAFLGMLSSVFIAETGKGDASAINQAGSLRMQSYRVATAVLYYQNGAYGTYPQVQSATDEFVSRLKDNRLVRALPKSSDDPLRATYDSVESKWHSRIEPFVSEAKQLVDRYRLGEIGEERIATFQAFYLANLADFFNEVDYLVKLIENAAEAKIERLRIIQVVTLFLTLAVVFITMHLMHTDVLIPLRDLLAAAEKARHGDFSGRVSHTSNDELGRLGNAFNVMSADLSRKYADLEARVREKTIDLEQSNRSLELLYNTSVLLNAGPLTESTYRLLLEDIRKLVGTGPGTICLTKHNDIRALKLASTRTPEQGRRDLCNPPECINCFGAGTTHLIDVPRGRNNLRVISIPIRDQNHYHGVLLIEIPPGKRLADWQTRLIETVAQNIANAITIAERDTESRRLALLEERSVIARELHDSLAQSLSYLKIQVSRIHAALKKPDGKESAQAVVEELREGLNSAYRQLRELLTTFRLKMDGHGLSKALEETVREFAIRSNVTVELHDRLYSAQLTANEEIHTLQLVREAIGNVIKHAEATHAAITLDSNDEGYVTVVVEDDGQGIPPSPQRRQHYGLAIMEERAQILGGNVTISTKSEGGTRVELNFLPSTRRPVTKTETETG
ncbi:ATP-binding protein [Thiohalomonas denitrificans]|uniref:ATP-binding protein n=1 Tax=Thiohalomonas denitrificans TaxID=415747 RepID=UPI0026F14F15|nr:ATP-binding protein [Thiohalomonas denitrificans]